MPLRITSAANAVVKTLKSLHAKKGRAETGLFLAEGARIVAEAASAGRHPEIVAVSDAAMERAPVRALVEAAEARGARAIAVSEALLAQIAKRENPQTIIGAFAQHVPSLEDLAGDFFVALEGVRDPGNLGTILRTADCVGASGVILVDQTCDPFSVEAVRASMGSIFAMPFARARFDALDAWRRERGLALVAGSLNGAWDEAAYDGARPIVLLMGNEQSGLPVEMEARADARVRLPMRGRADSLNLAAATAIMLYDVWRRRGYAGA